MRWIGLNVFALTCHESASDFAARAGRLDIFDTVFLLIDTHSFSSMWFWIVLAVFWSVMSHFVIGVPFDLVQRAARNGGQAMEDVEALARINANRLLQFTGAAGVILTGVAATLLSMLGLLGFLYDVEVCQALFFLAVPFTLVNVVAQRTARLVHEKDSYGLDLIRRLRRHRLVTQVIGFMSIFVTAFWGIFQTMNASVLGG